VSLRRVAPVLALAGALAVACDDLAGPLVCTAEAVAGITVTLRSVEGGPLLADDAQGRAADPAQPEIGERLVGVWEAPGTYVVTVEKPGFMTWVRGDVRVEAGECHVVPVHLDAALTPVP
jgi:uncharacterized cupin superfamily protein